MRNCRTPHAGTARSCCPGCCWRSRCTNSAISTAPGRSSRTRRRGPPANWTACSWRWAGQAPGVGVHRRREGAGGQRGGHGPDRRPAYRDVLTAVRGAVFMAFGRPQEALQALHGLSLDGDCMAGLFGRGPQSRRARRHGERRRGDSMLGAGGVRRTAGPGELVGVPHPVQYLNTVMFALEEEGRLDEA